ncbi:DUF3173 family protein [Psychrobacillus sp. FSL K6-1267]|uniref:DUF3173 family protein n=1 Tax=Psychrobacillus sp. FSL K6-1267 TaxID=2921543 RepID=UPI0030F74383
MSKTMVNLEDLKRAGFPPYTASNIIRQAKHYMVQQGYEFYGGRRISVVPIQAVKSVIGDVELSEKTEE